MKNATILLVICFFAISLAAQPSFNKADKTTAVTFAPYHLFTNRGELQLGFQHQSNRKKSFELELAVQVKGSEDPKLDPYFNQTLVGTEIKTVHKGVGFFLFLPVFIGKDGKDKDWTEKTVHREYYTTNHGSITASYRFYLVPTMHDQVPGGFYLSPGLTIGKRGVAEYIYAEGQKGYVTTLDTDLKPDELNPWGIALGTGFIGKVKVVEENLYDFSRLEIKRYHKNYLVPQLRLGFQLPIARHFSADLSALAAVNDRTELNKTGNFFRLEPSVKLGAWF
ncbi:MAG: hypothetical protein IPN76_22725 [Saprospiraceae bacterium]|nr:hypothetical protein [Saprospiraceae bacterium]